MELATNPMYGVAVLGQSASADGQQINKLVINPAATSQLYAEVKKTGTEFDPKKHPGSDDDNTKHFTYFDPKKITLNIMLLI